MKKGLLIMTCWQDSWGPIVSLCNVIIIISLIDDMYFALLVSEQ